MYTYGNRQSCLAQSLLTSLYLPHQVSEDCSARPIICLNQWDVAGKIHDIIRLRDVPSEFLI